ncbi:MAG: ABC transporter permease subunit [Thermaceae bacterium]|nr:ABC transporter permease subunit [Thermaceae bacterium]
MNRMFPTPESVRPRRPFSRWDFLVIPGIVVLLVLLDIGFKGAAVPFGPGTPNLTVNLNPANLPYYGLRTLLRMAVALLCSLTFTFVYATVAARVPRAERVMIPILDFLQSLPILGFLTATTTIFLGLFRGNLLGLEAVSIFAIFTSQVWNMTFSFYASLTTQPKELQEAAIALRLSPWQRFWKLDVPYAMPGLVWNTMMSVSGGWFFVVASEVISVTGRDQSQFLPGVGSYVGLAIQQADVRAMVYAGITVLLLVLFYDQLFFRPLVAWSEKFKLELSEGKDVPQSWVLTALQRARFAGRLARLPVPLWEWLWLKTATGSRPGKPQKPRSDSRTELALNQGFNLLLAVGSAVLLLALGLFLFGPGLGVQGGQILGANPNLNRDFSPQVAQQFGALGVKVGPTRAVWLSQVCPLAGPQLEKLLEATVGPFNLATACQRRVVPPGKVALGEIPHVFKLGLFTALRVTVLVFLVMLFWIPVGVWIGLRPRVAQWVQPLAQFAAAFPANLLFPVFVVFIVHFKLNPEFWTAPLMVLGTQWYVTFNIIAGATSLPSDLKEVAQVTHLKGWNWWRRLVLPGIFPAFVTGGITATGNSWNTSIVAEVVSWGSTTLTATGLGAYIAHWSTGEFNPHVGLGVLVMGLWVLAYNRLIWRPLYRLAEEKYRLG